MEGGSPAVDDAVTDPVTASLLTSGKVLVTLDYGCGPGDGAELYDPSNGTFTVTGSMTALRGPIYTATLLPDATVFIAGGGDSALGGNYSVDRASGECAE